MFGAGCGAVVTRLERTTGKLSEAGAGDGEGYTINLPLPGDSGHAAMGLVLNQVVGPAAAAFRPDLILVSAGTADPFLIGLSRGVGCMKVPPGATFATLSGVMNLLNGC